VRSAMVWDRAPIYNRGFLSLYSLLANL
jgi:hypothetical protein